MLFREQASAVNKSKGKKRAVIISNISDKPEHIITNLPDDMSGYMIDDTKKLEKVHISAVDFYLPSGAVVLLKNY